MPLGWTGSEEDENLQPLASALLPGTSWGEYGSLLGKASLGGTWNERDSQFSCTSGEGCPSSLVDREFLIIQMLWLNQQPLTD